VLGFLGEPSTPREAVQAFQITLASPSVGAQLGTATADGEILNDDFNTQPVAVADGGIRVYEDATTLNLWDRLLANDSDADGDPLTIIGLDTAGTVGTVRFDAEHKILTYAAFVASQDALKPTWASPAFADTVTRLMPRSGTLLPSARV
jgi:hypothetical protein